MSEERWIKQELKEVIIYIFIGLILCIAIPTFFGFALRGFESSFSSNSIKLTDYLGSYLIYVFLFFLAFGVIIFPIARIIAFKEDENPVEEENPTWFRILTMSYLFNPEESLLWKVFEVAGFSKHENPMKFFKSWIRVFIISLIVFGWIALIQLQFPALNIAGIPHNLPQQITLASDLSFGAGIPAFAENGALLFLMFFLLGINAFICSKYKLGWGVFFGLCIIIVLTCGLVWVSYHTIVYGNQDAKYNATLLFGILGCVITIAVGIFIPFLVWHFMNNFAVKINTLSTSKESLMFIFIIFLVLITISYIVGEYLAYRYRKSHRETIENIA